MRIEPASAADYESVRAVDETDGGPDRADTLREHLARGECLIARKDDADAIGYAVADRSFFGQAFIALVVVHPAHRRQGVAAALIHAVAARTPEPKLFTSTNESNRPMQAVLSSLGFVRSGIVENLDDGDPELIYCKHLR
jgi:ribosomal protein S18 acetylase RimI-like enzyme